jgi:NitT/TauT family transport system ATP-binding protein
LRHPNQEASRRKESCSQANPAFANSPEMNKVHPNAMPTAPEKSPNLSPASTRPSAGVKIQNLSKTFDAGVQAIDNLTLEFTPGEFAAILGPSGSGKSTLLRIIASLDRPTTGTAHIESTQSSLHEVEGSLAYVFQDAHLLPWRTLLRNVALPLELQRIPKPARLAAAEQALAQVGLSDAAQRYPAQLSGGMKMRASLARALVTQPNLLLLDEPFAALDEITRQKLDEQLRQLWSTHRMTVLFVTHSTTEAAFLANRAVVLTSRPARLVADLPIDLPADRTAPLRATPEFAKTTRAIYEALERGGA